MIQTNSFVSFLNPTVGPSEEQVQSHPAGGESKFFQMELKRAIGENRESSDTKVINQQGQREPERETRNVELPQPAVNKAAAEATRNPDVSENPELTPEKERVSIFSDEQVSGKTTGTVNLDVKNQSIKTKIQMIQQQVKSVILSWGGAEEASEETLSQLIALVRQFFQKMEESHDQEILGYMQGKLENLPANPMRRAELLMAVFEQIRKFLGEQAIQKVQPAAEQEMLPLFLLQDELEISLATFTQVVNSLNEKLEEKSLAVQNFCGPIHNPTESKGTSGSTLLSGKMESTKEDRQLYSSFSAKALLNSAETVQSAEKISSKQAGGDEAEVSVNNREDSKMVKTDNQIIEESSERAAASGSDAEDKNELVITQNVREAILQSGREEPRQPDLPLIINPDEKIQGEAVSQSSESVAIISKANFPTDSQQSTEWSSLEEKGTPDFEVEQTEKANAEMEVVPENTLEQEGYQQEEQDVPVQNKREIALQELRRLGEIRMQEIQNAQDLQPAEEVQEQSDLLSKKDSTDSPFHVSSSDQAIHTYPKSDVEPKAEIKQEPLHSSGERELEQEAEPDFGLKEFMLQQSARSEAPDDGERTPISQETLVSPQKRIQGNPEFSLDSLASTQLDFKDTMPAEKLEKMGQHRFFYPDPIQETEILQQIIKKAGLTLRNGHAEMHVLLRPEQLGRVKMALEVEQSMVFARFQVENYQVKQIIETHLPLLKQSLNEQGISVEQFEVWVGTEQRSNQERMSEEMTLAKMKNNKPDQNPENESGSHLRSRSAYLGMRSLVDVVV